MEDNLTLPYSYSVGNCSMPMLTAGRYNFSLDVQDSSVGYGSAALDTVAISVGEGDSLHPAVASYNFVSL